MTYDIPADTSSVVAVQLARRSSAGEERPRLSEPGRQETSSFSARMFPSVSFNQADFTGP
jgi:hypothetical protein